MKPRRVVLTGELFEAVCGGAALPPDAVHHLTRVLRLTAGSEIEITNGCGALIAGELCFRESQWSVEVRLLSEEIETIPERILCAALIKPKRWRLVVEKAVELGVSTVLPVVCHRTNLRITAERTEGLLDRWNKIAREAAKQCRRSHLPRIEAPLTWDRAVSVANCDIKLIASLGPGAPPILSLLENKLGSEKASIVLAIGPEGGFTDDEQRMALDHGFEAASLGPLPLRAETAAIVGLGLVSCHQNRLPGDLGLATSGV